MNEMLQNNTVRKSLVAVLILLSVFLLAKTINELKGASEEGMAESTIVVSGEGRVFAVPDIANFSFTVTKENNDVKKAQDAVSESISKILDSLESFDIEEKDIKTLGYNVYPRYEFRNRTQICPAGFSCPPVSGERTLVGYEVSQTVSIKLRDISKAGDVLNSLGGSGIDNLNGPNFEIEEREDYERDARKMAIDVAKEKAEDLADDLGVKLVRIVSFNEGGNFPIYQTRNLAFDEALGSGGSIPTPEIPVGESEIFSSVSIVYEIK